MNHKTHKFWLGTPPWIIIGSVIIFLPIFVFWTHDTINRQKEATTLLMLEKGAALIRSFEAGARTGMMGMMGRFQLQRLLMETAQQPDIVYIIVTDVDGTVRAHSDPDKIGMVYGKDLNLKRIAQSGRLRWRLVSNPDGVDTFEVFRRFSPIKDELSMRHRGMMPDRGRYRKIHPDMDEPETGQVIFVGLDMGPIELARKEETRHILMMAGILLLIGFGGIFSLVLVQAYRSTSSTLTRIKVFSDSVVENMPLGLVALDGERRVVSVNHVAESLIRVPSSQIINKPIDEVLPRKLGVLLNEVGPVGRTVEKEMDCLFPDGRRVPLDVSISRLESDDKTFLGYLILCRDLTEVQSLKQEIERSQRLASIGRLAAGIAHEIRNPLSSIKGFATYFKERYGEIPEDKKTAEIMVQEVERLNRVISQLLEFARPVAIHKKSMSIRTLVQHSLRIIERDAHKKNIAIHADIPSGLGEIAIDADRINQVLLNLYLNAIESMNGGGSLTVDIQREEENKRLTIRVTDTGSGIDKKNLVHIFDPYFTTKQSGTGLGLAIVHKIMESHQGEVRVESEPGKGTTVMIFLPLE